MRHHIMKTMEVLPYRSKMACTPAMALRLFSSFEKTCAFSAGPEAGMAAAAATGGGFWPITREKQTFQTRPVNEVTRLVDALCCCFFLVSTNNRRHHKALVLRWRHKQPWTSKRNAEVPRSRIRPGDLLILERARERMGGAVS